MKIILFEVNNLNCRDVFILQSSMKVVFLKCELTEFTNNGVRVTTFL